jgi:shikimate kinase
MAPKVVLTGFMATGKSVVSRALAKRLEWPLVDCDALLEQRAGKPISVIFSENGETHFRELERDLIDEITADSHRCAQCGNPRPAVIATGGGAIVDARNYAALAKIGVVVCLTARPEVIARRIGPKAAARPMLTRGGKPLQERIAELLAERREAYARPPIIVDTSDVAVNDVVDAILSALAGWRLRQWAASA